MQGNVHIYAVCFDCDFDTEMYALDIGKKIKSAAHQAMLDGEFIGARAPFGYKKSPDNCHKLIVDEATAPIVRQIFEWAASEMGINTIAVRLNKIGAVTSSVYKSQTSEVEKRYRQNRNWATFTVAHILENPVYTGDMVQGKSKTIEHRQQDTPPEDYIIVRDIIILQAASRSFLYYLPTALSGFG